MQVFEYLMVLVSIIIGLGIASLLTGVADCLRHGFRGRTYWVHSVVVIGVFFAHVQVWWESWGLGLKGEWTFLSLLLMLASPLMLFLVAHLLFPEEVTEDTDLENYYYELAPVVWPLGAAAAALGSLFRPLAFGDPLFEIGNAATVPTVLICLLMARTQNRRLHAILVPTLVVVILLDSVLITRVLGSGGTP